MCTVLMCDHVYSSNASKTMSSVDISLRHWWRFCKGYQIQNYSLEIKCTQWMCNTEPVKPVVLILPMLFEYVCLKQGQIKYSGLNSGVDFIVKPTCNANLSLLYRGSFLLSNGLKSEPVFIKCF